MASKKSNFSGFIDGYKAGNIASFSTAFRNKKYEIRDYADKIIFELSSLDISDKSMEIELKSLSAKLLSSLDDFDSLIALGESLFSIKNAYLRLDEPYKNKVERYFQKIISYFLELAKKCGDDKLLDLAIEIGEDI